ncbi:MAG: type II secretion system F family protein [Hyphomonadaceae bacterium]
MIGAALAFVAIAGAGVALAGGKQTPQANKKRVKAVGARSIKRKDQAEIAAIKRRQTTSEALKDLANNEKQSRKQRVSIKGQLVQAGLDVSLTQYWIGAGALGAALALIGFLIQQGPIGPAMGAAIGVFGLPRWILGFLIAGRQKKFASQLADAIDVIVRGVKSGLPLNQCLRIIASESPAPLSTEFKSVVDGQAMGVPLDQNLQRLYDRMPLPEVNFFVIVLGIQQKTGGNLSESLGNLSTVLRARKLMREKVKALSSEAKASAMIIGALPFIVMAVVYVTRPEYISLLFTDRVGNLILLGAGVMMMTGIMVMRSMINFKF